MERLKDWDIRLWAFLRRAERRRFEWGQHDCALFACNCIKLITGMDVAKPWRGRYKTHRGAAGTLRRIAGGGLEAVAETIAATNNFEEVPVNFARRGDVVLLDEERGPALCVVGSDGVFAVGPGPDGLKRVPVIDCRRAWRIA